MLQGVSHIVFLIFIVNLLRTCCYVSVSGKAEWFVGLSLLPEGTEVGFLLQSG